MAEPLVLAEDRCFDPDPAVRRVARTLYDETRRLPIISPHGHVDPRVLAANEAFAEPAALIVRPDHYILRLLYARGVPLESLLEGDARKAWQLFAEHYFLFQGTPTGAWLDHELHELFGVTQRLSGETAGRIYDAIVELRRGRCSSGSTSRCSRPRTRRATRSTTTERSVSPDGRAR